MRVRASLLLVPAAAVLFSGCPSKSKPKGPPAPTGLTAVAGNDSVTLDWLPVEKADRYIIYMAEEPGITKENYDTLNGGNRFDGGTNEPPVLLDFLQNGTTYFFIVTSVSAKNYEGSESQEVSASPSPWGPPTMLQTSSGEAAGLVAGVDAAGNIHALWARAEDLSTQRIHAARFDDSTQAWGTTIAVLDSRGGIAGTPSVAVHPNGDAIAAWRQGTGPNDRIWGAFLDSINGWDPPFVVTDTAAGAARNPAAAYAGDDVFLAWAQNYVSGTAGTITGSYAKVGANGGPLGATEQIDAMTATTDLPRIVAGGGIAMAALIEGGAIITNEWDGAFAGAAVTGTSDEASFITLATNADGDFAMAWVEQNLTTDLYVAQYDPLGGVWMDPTIVDGSALDVAEPRIAVCEGGEMIVVWLQLAGLHYRILGARWTPIDDWSAPEIIHESIEGDSADPFLAVNANCDARVVWVQEDIGAGGPGATFNIYSSRLFFGDLPEDWGPPLLVSDYGLNTSPILVIDGDGDTMALWEYYGPTGDQIWWNILGD